MTLSTNKNFFFDSFQQNRTHGVHRRFATSGAAVISRGTNRCMDSSNHEEADTRILVHLQDTLNNGTTTCLVRTVDTDVVVIIVGKLHTLLNDHPSANV